MSETTPHLADELRRDESLERHVWRLWHAGTRPDVRELLAGAGELKPAEIVTAVRVDQHQRWHSGERIAAETYLELCPTLATDPESAVELVYGEFLLREELGESPTLAEYTDRFPHYAERLSLQVELHRAMDSACLEEAGGTTSFWGRPPKQAAHQSLDPGESDMRAVAVPGYQILGVLGRGGMGVVYKARQCGLNRPVALKMVLAGGHAAPEQLERFRTEAEAAARLHHPNIVEIYAVGEQAGWPYLAMEFVDSGTLAQRLDGTPQPARAAAELVETLARAIQFAHERGVVHRSEAGECVAAGRRSGVEGRRPEGRRHVPSFYGPRPWILDPQP
jgi:serine/threonine-protein kinase